MTIPYQTSRKSLIYKNHFGNYERVTFYHHRNYERVTFYHLLTTNSGPVPKLIERVTLYHPIPEFDHVAPRIASFNDGELANEDVP